jgi:hypothetical protein
LIRSDGTITSTVWIPPAEPLLLKWILLFRNIMIHPSIVCRKSVLIDNGGYSTRYPHNEDYDLWARLSGSSEITNLTSSLIYYRVHDNSTSVASRNVQLQHRLEISQRAISDLLEEDALCLKQVALLSMPQKVDIDATKDTLHLLDRLRTAFIRKHSAGLSGANISLIDNDVANRKKAILELHPWEIRLWKQIVQLMRSSPYHAKYFLIDLLLPDRHTTA